MVTTALALVLYHSPLLVAAGLLVFLLPGAVLLAGMRVALRLEERLAYWFAASLVLLTATFATCVLAGTSIAATPAVLAVLTIAAAVTGRRLVPASPPIDLADRIRPGPAHFVIVAGAIACLVAAIEFAPVGSVDRWWYLAYVRGYLEAAPLDLAEPFLGTGQSFARFGFHPWLLGLAMWSWLSGIDPVEVYENAAPVLVVLTSVSATAALAIELFGRTARTRLSILATMLLWCGGLLPLLARAGEDKVLATAALLPLCLAAFLRAIRAGHAARPGPALVLLFVAAAATAAVHALVLAFVLVALLPAAALFAITLPHQRRTLSLAVTVLLAVAVAPAASGLVVAQRLSEIGATLANSDHPVVRVHDARERLLELPVAGYVANPRLLFHPLALLALVGVLGLAIQQRAALERRARALEAAASAAAMDDDDGGPDGDSPVSPEASASRAIEENSELVTRFLLVTTVVPLAIAFLPPFPALAGSVIPPWMVYRVLWLVPLAPLAAIAADSLAARYSRRETLAVLVLVVLALPAVLTTAQNRLADVRARLAAPPGEDFVGTVAAIASLPADALVVAAPELSERLPALTGRHVVAGLDRSTVVFSGSREQGEARLRARAALLTGSADGDSLARKAGIVPTHAVFDPRADQQPACSGELHRGEAYALCVLAARSSEGNVAAMRVSKKGGDRPVAEAECRDSGAASGKRNPWSAAAPEVLCTVTLSAGAPEHLELHVDSETGRATDELRVEVRDSTGRAHLGAARTSGEGVVVLELPPLGDGPLEVRVASSFLPAVRLKRVAVVAR